MLGSDRTWEDDIVPSNNSSVLSSEDRLETFKLLANDKKFMKALKTIEKEVIPAFGKLMRK